MDSEAEPLRYRVLAAAFYFGLSPLLRNAMVRRFSPFLRFHHAHALAAFTALGMILIVASGMLALDTYLLINFRGFSKSSAVWLYGGFCWTVVGLAFVYAWCPALLFVARGLQRNVRGMARIAGCTKALLAGRIVGTTTIVVGVLLAATTFRAMSLSGRNDSPGSVYMLYDDLGIVPRWVFCLGFYRMSAAATARWGSGAVVVDQLSFGSLGKALRNGRVLFIASHGADGRIIISGAGLPPLAELKDIANPDMRLVYIAACDAGQEAANWERVLAPARVITFDRISLMVEHVWWLWTTGPREISTLESIIE